MQSLTEFNSASKTHAVELIWECCASPHWAEAMVMRRPYRTYADLSTAAASVFDRLSEAEIALAHNAHPPIGSRKTALSPWSVEEQSSSSQASTAISQQLDAANIAYEEKFGQVFLICATGLSATHILAESTRRLENSPKSEAIEARAQLRQIMLLRLAKAVK